MRQTSFDPEQLRDRLRGVRWIGGGSGAGKSTIARRLAADYGFRLYDTDAAMTEHVRRANLSDTPLLRDFLAMDMDERWANRPPGVMLKTFPWFAGEGFDLIVEDLLASPEEPPILVEGFRLLPRLVAPLLSHSHQAVWLVPTPKFRLSAFDSRGSTWKIAMKTSKPERALSNLLARDALFTEEVIQETAALELRMIKVDSAITAHELAVRVADHFGLTVR